MEKTQPEETAAFIRKHRSNESNFAMLHEALEKEIAKANGDYKTQLQEVKEKQAAAYENAKKNSGAWPEFESFVSAFEKAVIEAMHKEQ